MKKRNLEIRVIKRFIFWDSRRLLLKPREESNKCRQNTVRIRLIRE